MKASSRILVCGRGRDVPALSRPVPAAEVSPADELFDHDQHFIDVLLLLLLL